MYCIPRIFCTTSNLISSSPKCSLAARRHDGQKIVESNRGKKHGPFLVILAGINDIIYVWCEGTMTGEERGYCLCLWLAVQSSTKTIFGFYGFTKRCNKDLLLFPDVLFFEAALYLQSNVLYCGNVKDFKVMVDDCCLFGVNNLATINETGRTDCNNIATW